MNQNEAKQLAARAAADRLPESGIIGLGSGSTAALFIDLVGELVRSGRDLTGVPTSEASARQARALGIPLLPDDGPWSIDVCVDGADEISDQLDVIKGGGGCHTREKIVNQASAHNIIVVDDSKLSSRLGENWAIPLEVIAFAHRATHLELERLGPVTLRTRDGAPWMTDAGNYLYDLTTGPLDQPAEMDDRLRRIPGVVETGLFIGRVHTVLVAGESGVQTLRRSDG